MHTFRWCSLSSIATLSLMVGCSPEESRKFKEALEQAMMSEIDKDCNVYHSRDIVRAIGLAAPLNASSINSIYYLFLHDFCYRAILSSPEYLEADEDQRHMYEHMAELLSIFRLFGVPNGV